LTSNKQGGGIFYGWYIVAAGIVLMAYDAALLVYGFSAFINPIAATFAWGYAQISLATSLRYAEMSILNPFLGAMIDRWPGRRLVFVGVVIMGLGLVCIGRATSLATFYLGFLIVGLGGSIAVYLVPSTAIARWFKKDIGKASGVLSLGVGIGGGLIPVLVKIIDTFGWQDSMIIMAIGVWVLGIPLSLVFRSRPEDYGLLPDGRKGEEQKSLGSSGGYDFRLGVKDVLRMRPFWHISVAFLIQMSANHTAIIHMMPYLASLDVARSTASIVAMLVPLISLGARIPFGWLADVFNKKYVFAGSLALSSAGLFLYQLVDTHSLGSMLLFAIVFGISVGGMIPIRTPILREYFGARNFGMIFGLSGVFTTMAMVLAPPLVGRLFDTRGTYHPIWFIFSGLALLGVIIAATTPDPTAE